MKILLICLTSNQIVTFRKSLIERFQSDGHDVYAITFDDEQRELVESRGVKLFCVNGSNRSLNPFKILTLRKEYQKIIEEVNPDIVFTFMLKPNIFGVRAAKKAGVNKIFSMVEGAGDVFINNGIKWKMIRYVICKMYRRSFRYSNKVVFLNNDDKAEFIARKLVKEEQCEIVSGIGVDLERFEYRPMKNDRTFIMIARMLRTKGVLEYCKAARIVKQQYPDAVFNYLGAEGTLKVSDIQEYIDDGIINYLGTTKDVRPYFEDARVNVLPSYREGFGLVNAEAGAIGRPTITCDTVGSRDTVTNGYNGFLVNVGDYEALAEKIIWCIEHPDEVEEMGKNSRKMAEEKFNVNVINDKLINIIFG